MPFDMPPITASFADRGHWLVQHLMAEFRLVDYQAAGIVGNLGFESHLKAVQEISPIAGRGGYGWAQWTAGRRVSFEAFCSAQGLAQSSDEANYRYLVSELHGAYGNTIRAVQKVFTVDAAVFSVGETYERPYGTTATYLPGFNDRLSYAKQALSVSTPIDAAGAEHISRNKIMQAALKQLGLYSGDIDGLWGPKSRAAEAAFAAEAA